MCANPKVTPDGSIEMEGNLPVIKEPNQDEVINAVKKCPASCFIVRKDGEKLTKKDILELEKQNEVKG
jgi:hypothetical protein